MVSDGISQVVHSRTGTGSSSANGSLNSTAAKRRQVIAALHVMRLLPAPHADDESTRWRFDDLASVRAPSVWGFVACFGSSFEVQYSATTHRRRSVWMSTMYQESLGMIAKCLRYRSLYLTVTQVLYRSSPVHAWAFAEPKDGSLVGGLFGASAELRSLSAILARLGGQLTGPHHGFRKSYLCCHLKSAGGRVARYRPRESFSISSSFGASSLIMVRWADRAARQVFPE